MLYMVPYIFVLTWDLSTGLKFNIELFTGLLSLCRVNQVVFSIPLAIKKK